MKSSKSVKFTALTAISALIMAACANNENYQHCVDDKGVVVDDTKCAGAVAGSPFRWYYVPRLFSVGSRVSGGSYTRSPSLSYTPRASAGSSSLFGGSSKSTTVSRGGFGSSGKGISVGA
jgi:hypothetical protein